VSEETEYTPPLRRKDLEEKSIELALAGHWEEAARCNRLLLENEPNDVDTLNRLGKALMEMGLYEEAQDTYTQALELDPYNRIARRNLQRLTVLIKEKKKKTTTEARGREQIRPDLFISESGKSAVVPLRSIPKPQLLQELSRGEIVRLEISEQGVLVKNSAGEILGRLDPRVGQRIAEFMQVGNRYVAAISEIEPGGAKVFIRETYQHPRLLGRPSFPPIDISKTEIVRPYVRDWGLRLQEALELSMDEEDEEEEEDELDGLTEETPFDEDYEEDLEDTDEGDEEEL
jgi:hypothetical protein